MDVVVLMTFQQTEDYWWCKYSRAFPSIHCHFQLFLTLTAKQTTACLLHFLQFRQRQSRKKAFRHHISSDMLLCHSTISPRIGWTILKWDREEVFIGWHYFRTRLQNRQLYLAKVLFIFSMAKLGWHQLSLLNVSLPCCAVSEHFRKVCQAAQHGTTQHYRHLHLQNNWYKAMLCWHTLCGSVNGAQATRCASPTSILRVRYHTLNPVRV